MWDGDKEKDRNGKAYIQQHEDSAVIQESAHTNKTEICNIL